MILDHDQPAVSQKHHSGKGGWRKATHLMATRKRRKRKSQRAKRQVQNKPLKDKLPRPCFLHLLTDHSTANASAESLMISVLSSPLEAPALRTTALKSSHETLRDTSYLITQSRFSRKVNSARWLQICILFKEISFKKLSQVCVAGKCGSRKSGRQDIQAGIGTQS